jgi:hypothetical protein
MTLRAIVSTVLLLFAVTPAAVATEEDAYLRGYVAAVLEREFRLTLPSLRVQNGVVHVDAAEVPAANRARIVAALGALRGVARVQLSDTPPLAPQAPPIAQATPTAPERTVETAPPRVLKEFEVGLMPSGHLFNPLIADPRWPHLSAAYHYYLNDRDLRSVGAVSLGEAFSIYRDRIGGGWWDVGVQAGVFAVFDLETESKDLINADYLFGIPLSYRYHDFSAMLRLFHQSSHLGDEFLLRSRARRVNLSYEAVDLKLSYEFRDMLRVYGGGGYLFDQDPSSLKPWSTQFGFEFRSPWPEPSAKWRPIAATDIQHREENNWHTDFSLRAGVELAGILASRNFQILLEYFRGNSPNGQFYQQKIDYIGLGGHFHF